MTKKEDIKVALKKISGQCGIRQEDLEVETNTVHGNELIVSGRKSSFPNTVFGNRLIVEGISTTKRAIKPSEFVEYLEGFKDSCSVVRDYNAKHHTKPPS